MRRQYPNKQPGDPLSANHINELSRSSEKFERLAPGSFINIRHTNSNISISGNPPAHTWPVKISNLIAMTGDTENSGLYKVRNRIYRYSSGEWIQLEKEWILDERAVSEAVGGFEVGDIVVSSWNEQAGVFIPLSTSTNIKPARLTQALVSGGSASAVFLTGSSRGTSGKTFTVYDTPTFITSGKQIPNNTNIRVYYDSVVGEYVLLTVAACEEDQ